MCVVSAPRPFTIHTLCSQYRLVPHAALIDAPCVARRFSQTKRFTAAVAAINTADAERFPKVLLRLLKALPDKVRADSRRAGRVASRGAQPHAVLDSRATEPPLLSRAQGSAAFNEEERQQLCDVFGLTEVQLELLLGGSAFILEQAAYATTPPETLRTELLDAGLGDDHARAFSSVWQAGAAEVVQAFKERSVLAPQQLAAVDWQLCVDTAGSDGGRSQAAHAVLQLELAAPLPPGGTGGAAAGGGGAAAAAEGREERTPVHVRVGVEAMEGLLRKLDAIQGQMDRLQ